VSRKAEIAIAGCALTFAAAATWLAARHPPPAETPAPGADRHWRLAEHYELLHAASQAYIDGRNDDAERAAVKLIERAPPADVAAAAWHTAGLVHERRHDYGDAASCFTRAIELDASARYYKARAEAKRQQAQASPFEEAFRLRREADADEREAAKFAK
jgi:tetratricopeptide (TPR) repeat protein